MSSQHGRAGAEWPSESSSLPRRQLGRGRVGVSVLGARIATALSVGVSPTQDVVGVALLRRALEVGIGFFDTGPASLSAASEELAALAFPETSSDIAYASTLTGERPLWAGIPAANPALGSPPGGPSAFGADPRAWANEADGAVERALTRLHRSELSIAWIESSDVRVLRDPRTRSRLDTNPRVGAWGVRFLSGPPEVGSVQELLSMGIRLFGFEFHLLNAAGTHDIVATIAAGGAALIDLDPHADGRLNGRLLSGLSTRAGATPPRPTDWGTLRSRLEPVTRLGFLTEGRQRSLAQAALQYALGSEGVVSALVEIDDPRSLLDWVRSPQTPALTPRERHEVEDRARSGT